MRSEGHLELLKFVDVTSRPPIPTDLDSVADTAEDGFVVGWRAAGRVLAALLDEIAELRRGLEEVADERLASAEDYAVSGRSLDTPDAVVIAAAALVRADAIGGGGTP